jgi:hypothetical protein
MLLGAGSDIGKCNFVKPPFQTKKYLRNVTRSLRHLDCRWLCAKHVPISPCSQETPIWSLSRRTVLSLYKSGRSDSELRIVFTIVLVLSIEVILTVIIESGRS